MNIPLITEEQQKTLDMMVDNTPDHINTINKIYRDERIEKASANSFDRLNEVNAKMAILNECIANGNAQQIVWRSGELIVSLTRMVEEYTTAKELMEISGRYQAIRILTQQTAFN